MAATYTMQEMKDLHNENETILYPRMIIKGQCSTEELIEDIAHHTTYNTGELRGMIMALKDAMAREMSRGYSVKLDEIGTFTPSLGITEGKEAEQPAGETRRNARSIKIRNINFRADKELIRKTEGHCTLERESGTSKLKTSHHSSEKRLKMALDFLTTPVHDGGGLHGPHRLEPYYRSQGTSEVGNNTRNRHTPQGAAHTQSLCGRHR